jgi:hypothetical protein
MQSGSGTLLGAALCVGLGLAVTAVPAAGKKVEAKPSTVLTEDSRGFVSGRIGVPIEIRLKAQPGTGFSWAPTRPVAGLTDMKPIKAYKPKPGSSQVQRFKFVPPARGTYRLNFSYSQPWRGGTKGAKTKSFIVVAR